MAELVSGQEFSHDTSPNAAYSVKGTVQICATNCDKKEDELKAGYNVVKFGGCSYSTTTEADDQAATVLIPLVMAAGGVLDIEFGHRTVRNWLVVSGHKIQLPDTYLAYARGNLVD
ncbi:MAG: hypothetical protein AAF921_15165 [Cyanobacteria bacterium P01_D01_bin.44]